MAIQNVGYLFAKGLIKIIKSESQMEPDYLERVIGNQTSSTAYVDWTAKVGPSRAVEKPKGQEFTERDTLIKVPKRVWHVTYGLQVRVPFEDIDDDQYAEAKTDAASLGRAIKSVMAFHRAMLLNGAFGTFYVTGYDGKALCASDHPLDYGAYPASTTDLTSMPNATQMTWSNVINSDLDYVALGDAITKLRRTPTWEGEPSDMEPKYLVTAPESWVTVHELLRSSSRPDNANDASNAMQTQGLASVQSSRIYDTDSWFLLSAKHDLNFFLRMGLTTKVNYDPSTWDWLTQAAVRFATGAFDPRGIVGSPGA